MISEQGIDLARRTVAKYREMLNIPSSSQRRMQSGYPNTGKVQTNFSFSQSQLFVALLTRRS